MPEPIIIPDKSARVEGQQPIAAAGQSFEIHEWRGSGSGYLHVHHSDDEAWHVLEGTLIFRFGDKEIEAPAGTTVFVPAGVAHAYRTAAGPTRYLIIMTPRLRALIAALQGAPLAEHSVIMGQFDSEVLE
jgi:mannose-6-phosphate isomerase-like protein (cupin superfamily)